MTARSCYLFCGRSQTIVENPFERGGVYTSVEVCMLGERYNEREREVRREGQLERAGQRKSG